MLRKYMISKKILDHLKKKKYKFEIIEHKTTYTAFDTAQTTRRKEKKIKPEEIVKAFVVKADKNYFLALVPATKKLDKKKLSKLAGAKSLDLAKEAWMKKNLPGKVGAIPPFRELVKLDIFIDAILARQENLYVGSGEYESSIKIPAKQYLKNEMPVKGNFAAKK